MIALDTNVLVRYLTCDDIEQAEAARALLESLTPDQPGFICREVLIEMIWVLERSYQLPRDRIADMLERLIFTKELVVEAADDVARVISRYRRGGTGFSDVMILSAAERASARGLYTFDRSLARIQGAMLVQADRG